MPANVEDLRERRDLLKLKSAHAQSHQQPGLVAHYEAQRKATEIEIAFASQRGGDRTHG